MKLGHIYEHSCLDPHHGLPAWSAKCVDHVITDPPYSTYVHAIGNRLVKKKATIEAVDMGFDAITEEGRKQSAEQFVRVARKWVLVFCDVESSGAWVEALVAAGAKRRSTVIWAKTGAAPKFNGDGPANASEAIVTAWAGKGKSVWNAGGAYGVYLHSVDRGDRRHNCQKPQDLMRQLVVDFTLPGESILDPYAGGGSTLIAAKSLDRRWVGFEIDPAYVAAAGKALQKARVQTTFEQMLTTRTRKAEAYGLKTRKPKQLEFDDPDA